MTGPPYLTREEFNYVGKRGLPRKDGYEKATGTALFTIDTTVPGMVYGKPLLSPYAHARIKSIDTSKAEALPGVILVFVGYEDPEFKDIEMSVETLWRPGPRKWHLFRDTAHYFAEPLGVWVVAVSELIVEDALRALEIEWEELPIILDWNEALKPGAPILRPEYNPDDNIAGEGSWEQGDTEAGFAEADQIIEFTQFKDPCDASAGVEPHSCIAAWRGDRIWLWAHNKWLARKKESFLKNIKVVPLQNLTVKIPYSGGNFSYQIKCAEAVVLPEIAVLLAKRAGRPVKALLDPVNFNIVEESNGEWHYKAGFKNDGTITSLHLEVLYGHYSMTSTPCSRIRSTTGIPNLSSHAVHPWVCRPTVSCGKHGANAIGSWTLTLNHVAAELGMDPTEVALKNDGAYGKWMADWEETKVEQGFVPRDSLKEGIELGKEAIDWDNKWHAPGTKILPNGKYHGMGFMCSYTWRHNPGTSSVGLSLQFGTVRILGYDYQDVGTNPGGTYCAIVADEAGMKYEDVNFMNREDYGFRLSKPSGSGGGVANSVSLAKAARDLKRQILELATKGDEGDALFPDKTPQELDIKDSVVFEKANPDNKFTVAEVADAAGREDLNVFAVGRKVSDIESRGGPPETDMWIDAPPVSPNRSWMRQEYFIEVEVDPETGMVDVVKWVAVNDAGKAINPDSFNGQQEAGACFGLSRSRIEGLFFDPQTGVRLNDNLLGYPMLTIADVGPTETIILETGQGYGAYGYSGCSESPVACNTHLASPAVYNAIGKWVDIPVTPDKILKALGKA